ncbi:MAG: hypothetical protein ACRDQA_19565, partial [Nocardioidaceae bacterium]
LRDGQGDARAEEGEGLVLVGGGVGEHGDLAGGAGEPDLVAGECGQVVEQPGEAAVGLPL